MATKKSDVSSPEFMEAMGRLMGEALESQEGMRALAVPNAE